MNILALILCITPAIADTIVPVGTAEIAPGTLITRQVTWFAEEGDRAFVVLKVVGEGLDDFGSNGRLRGEIWFSVPGLVVDRGTIRYGATTCAKRSRVFNNYWKRGCDIHAHTIRRGRDWFWKVDLIVEE